MSNHIYIPIHLHITWKHGTQKKVLKEFIWWDILTFLWRGYLDDCYSDASRWKWQYYTIGSFRRVSRRSLATQKMQSNPSQVVRSTLNRFIHGSSHLIFFISSRPDVLPTLTIFNKIIRSMWKKLRQSLQQIFTNCIDLVLFFTY